MLLIRARGVRPPGSPIRSELTEPVARLAFAARPRGPWGPSITRPRYDFAGFSVSPGRRQLLHEGRELALIPRYFDLLLLLLERRHEALHRREILDRVWSDVIVTDNALNQAVRTLRRILGDDSRQPRFIRTVARHGYQFVFADVRESEDGEAPPATPGMTSAPVSDSFEAALAALLSEESGAEAEERRREAAETLHRLGTGRVREQLEGRRNTARALATLRDVRWALPEAGPVPFFGHAGMWRSTFALARLRLVELWSLARRRWAHAVLGGALAGLFAGAAGAAVLLLGPGATAGANLLVVLPLVGVVLGATGAAGVAAGLTLGEATFRAARGVALVVGGALGGGLIGAVAHGFGAALLQGLFGRDLSAAAGGLEGLVIGGATGLGYALATPRREGGLATPVGLRRVGAALLAGAVCALATGVLGWNGSFLGAMSLDLVAGAFPGSEVGLEPLAQLLGEDEPGRISRVAVSAWEGLVFGTGVVLGLTHRPRTGDEAAEERQAPPSRA
jgi:DNA-binding winged helix-turn-helix (wHTH) protein